jgi:hypothetical protein
MPPGMTRYRRDSPATDVAGPGRADSVQHRNDLDFPPGPITHATADAIQAMLADPAGQDTHDPIGL